MAIVGMRINHICFFIQIDTKHAVYGTITSN